MYFLRVGSVIGGLNHAMHMGAKSLLDDDPVKAKNIGISKGTTFEEAIDKMQNKMKIGDYISGDELTDVYSKSDYINQIEKTGNESFKIKPGVILKVGLKVTDYDLNKNISINNIDGGKSIFINSKSVNGKGHYFYIKQNNIYFDKGFTKPVNLR